MEPITTRSRLRSPAFTVLGGSQRPVLLCAVPRLVPHAGLAPAPLRDSGAYPPADRRRWLCDIVSGLYATTQGGCAAGMWLELGGIKHGHAPHWIHDSGRVLCRPGRRKGRNLEGGYLSIVHVTSIARSSRTFRGQNQLFDGFSMPSGDRPVLDEHFHCDLFPALSEDVPPPQNLVVTGVGDLFEGCHDLPSDGPRTR